MTNQKWGARTEFVRDPVEEQVAHLVRQAAGSVAMFDTELRYLSASDGFLATYGLHRESVIGHTLVEVFGSLPDRWRQINDRALRGEDCRAELDLFIRKDGSPQWLRWSMTPWRRVDGEIGGAVTDIADVTETRKLHDSLRSMEAMLTALFENVSVGIAILDEDGRFERSNHAFRSITGYASDDLDGMFIGSAIHPDDAGAEIAAIERVRNGDRPLSETTFRLIRKDGRVIVAEQILAAIETAPCSGRRFAVMLRDVTERTDIELRLRQSERLSTIGLLAEALAHDLGNVLMAFRGATNGLRHAAESVPLPKAGIDGIDVLQQGTDYVGRLVDGMRLLAHDEQRDPVPADGAHAPKADLAEWWSRSSALLRTAIPPGIRLEARIDAGLGPARIDAGQLTQVVLNLVMNAAQAITDRGHPVGGTIVIEAKPEAGGERMNLSIADDGVGIEPVQMRRMTDRYVTTRSGSGGSGIGLSVAQRIVDGHGGRMHFWSKPGFGTTVTVTLPAADARGGAPALP